MGHHFPIMAPIRLRRPRRRIRDAGSLGDHPSHQPQGHRDVRRRIRDSHQIRHLPVQVHLREARLQLHRPKRTELPSGPRNTTNSRGSCCRPCPTTPGRLPLSLAVWCLCCSSSTARMAVQRLRRKPTDDGLCVGLQYEFKSHI
jgi:hypothetical protein